VSDVSASNAMGSSASGGAGLVTRIDLVLRPDPRRVITKLFLPGQEMLIAGESRATAVIHRVLAMRPPEVAATLAATLDSFTARHRDLARTLETNFVLVAHRLVDSAAVTTDQRLLIGAYFTQEYSIEAAALFNPSLVRHPDQDGLAPAQVRVVLSARAVGEGHLSSVEFRTGVVGPGPVVRIDDPGDTLVLGVRRPTGYQRDAFRRTLTDIGGYDETAAFVLDRLSERFTNSDLEAAIAGLGRQRLTRGSVDETIDHLHRIAACNYELEFPATSQLAERVIWPTSPAESHGMEDARFTRFVDDDGSVIYYATYTAFDGTHVAPHLLATADFRRFVVSQLTGPGARNKGMALFPRRIGGQYVALSRWDRENNAIATSADGHNWDVSATLQTPEQPWELIQLGNCGPPIETPRGWLVLTHGVGPLRVYAIGAILLDLDDPHRVIGRLTEPLLTPNPDERDGYVPNVVYSCGALVEHGTLVLPYGCSDSSIRIACVDLSVLLDRMRRDAPVPDGAP
jgi:predicted GH43/DUF377 family glycosyl hydrolase